MRVDFTKCEMRDVEGHVIHDEKPFWKGLAAYIYEASSNFDLVDIAQDLFRDGAAEMTDSMITELIKMVKDEKCRTAAFVKRNIVRHLEQVKQRNEG